MGEDLSTLEQHRSLEIKIPQPTVHLVAGSHITTLKEALTIANRNSEGDLDANVWEKEIGLRLIRLQPRTIVLDGISPYIEKMNIEDKKSLWQALPVNPIRLNENGRVNVIAGDTDFRDAIKLFFKNTTKPTNQETIGHEIEKNRDEIDGVSSIDAPDPAYYLSGLGITVLAAYAAAELTSKKLKTLSRRKFLVGLGWVATSTATILAGSGMFYKILPTQPISRNLTDSNFDILKKWVEKESHDHIVRNGRTALFIQKGIDAAIFLNENETTVVAGDGHKQNYDTYIEDIKARHAAIKTYARRLMEITDEISTVAQLSPEQNDKAKDVLLNALTLTQIISVKGIENNQVKSVNDSLDSAISLKSELISPGVEKAVSELRSQSRIVTNSSP